MIARTVIQRTRTHAARGHRRFPPTWILDRRGNINAFTLTLSSEISRTDARPDIRRSSAVSRRTPREYDPCGRQKRILWAKKSSRPWFPALRRRIIEHLGTEIQYFNRQPASLLTIELSTNILASLSQDKSVRSVD
jgi:hypothetical protein